MSVTFNYRIPKSGSDYHNIPPHAAAAKAKDKLLLEWEPSHWHLDAVSETDAFYTITFTAVPGNASNWHSADMDHR